MTIIQLKTPIREKEVRKIKVGDILYVSGKAITARDEAHKRALEYTSQGRELPLEFTKLVLYHCGPLLRNGKGGWEVIAAGPTTSMRMEPYEAEFIEKFRPSIIIGKGGMGSKTAKAVKQFGVVYCDFTGGAAVLAAKAIVAVQGVEWLDLGMPEALWILTMKDFGPLVVTIDSSGNNLRDNLPYKTEVLDRLLTD